MIPDTQRAILEALAHMRVAEEDAWQTTRQLTRFIPDEGRRLDRRYDRTYRALTALAGFALVEKRRTIPGGRVQWRITEAGRKALP